MHYEGKKETENTRIEMDEETRDEIEMLYTFDVVLFEHVILESETHTYSICYFAPEKIYDIVVEDKQLNRLEKYETTKQLDKSYEKYFKLNKNQKIDDIICTSHSIEYTL